VSAAPILLVRHGRAGDRSAWHGDDRDRPLDDRGRRQAEWLLQAVAEFEILRILTSPYARCVQTVAPLSQIRGVTLETTEALSEGAGAEARTLADELEGQGAVLCSHGDVIGHLLPGRKARKGSVWVLDRGRPVRYLDPPR
jgi:8-oxo-dGTP diphosphatase